MPPKRTRVWTKGFQSVEHLEQGVCFSCGRSEAFIPITKGEEIILIKKKKFLYRIRDQYGFLTLCIDCIPDHFDAMIREADEAPAKCRSKPAKAPTYEETMASIDRDARAVILRDHYHIVKPWTEADAKPRKRTPEEKLAKLAGKPATLLDAQFAKMTTEQQKEFIERMRKVVKKND